MKEKTLGQFLLEQVKRKYHFFKITHHDGKDLTDVLAKKIDGKETTPLPKKGSSHHIGLYGLSHEESEPRLHKHLAKHGLDGKVKIERMKGPLEESLCEAAGEDQAKRTRLKKIAEKIDKYIASGLYDFKTIRDLQVLNDMCILAVNNIDDANDYAIRAKAFPNDKLSARMATYLKNDSDKIVAMAETRISKMTPSLVRKGIHLT